MHLFLESFSQVKTIQLLWDIHFHRDIRQFQLSLHISHCIRYALCFLDIGFELCYLDCDSICYVERKQEHKTNVDIIIYHYTVE